MKRFRIYKATDLGLLEHYWQMMIQDKSKSRVVVYIGSADDNIDWKMYDQYYANDEDNFIGPAARRRELEFIESFHTLQEAKQFILEHYFEHFL